MARVEWPGAYDETAARLIAACERQPEDWTGYLVLADRLGEIAAGSAPEHALRWLAARRLRPDRLRKAGVLKRWRWWRDDSGHFEAWARFPEQLAAWRPAALPRFVFQAAQLAPNPPGRAAVFHDWADAVAFVADGLDELRRLIAVTTEE